MPRITKVVPAPLVAIVVLTIATVIIALNVLTIGGQGVANRLSGLFGGMGGRGGCAMTGQTMTNVKAAGTRISAFLAGVFMLVLMLLLVLVLVLGHGDLLAVAPQAALVSVMIMWPVSLFSRFSLFSLIRSKAALTRRDCLLNGVSGLTR
ncbi:MFS superfamily sulfate permease-like transporter [Cryobacterium sp. CAN_C2]